MMAARLAGDPIAENLIAGYGYLRDPGAVFEESPIRGRVSGVVDVC